QADQKIMEDAAIVPLLDRAQTTFRSSRVRNAYFLPTTAGYDYAADRRSSRRWRAARPEGGEKGTKHPIR
ncbi:hypothetical protein GWI34_45125, partial [Actinomadura sp. DSM 109109]|nr:hypothetical protein [Actinomadura lepetitiana]